MKSFVHKEVVFVHPRHMHDQLSGCMCPAATKPTKRSLWPHHAKRSRQMCVNEHSAQHCRLLCCSATAEHPQCNASPAMRGARIVMQCACCEGVLFVRRMDGQ